MNKPEEIAEELHNELLKEPVIQEYLRLKNLYFSNPELEELRTNIARLKAENKEEEWENLLEVYDKHPLVVNYKNALEDARELLEEIKEIISD